MTPPAGLGSATARAGAAEPGEAEVAVAFAGARALQAEAEAAWGTSVDEVLGIGGLRLRLRIVGDALAGQLLPALAHHGRSPVDDGWDVEIRAWDGTSTGGRLPGYPASALDGGTSGPARIEAERRGRHGRLRYQPDERALSLYDPVQRLGLFCVADPAELPYWERGAPMRTVFHWVMEDHGRCLVHAAAVGRPDGGLLIVGRGGSGKSTTALACVGRGLPYLSDDYCIVSPGPGPATAHSLYSTAKLHHDQLPRLPWLAGWAQPPRPGEDKALLFVGDHAPGDLIETFPVRAVVVPTITGEPTTRVVPTSGGAALGALAPSSVLQLPGGGAGALRLLAGLVRSTPSVGLALGTDIEALPRHLGGLLDDLAARGRP